MAGDWLLAETGAMLSPAIFAGGEESEVAEVAVVVLAVVV